MKICVFGSARNEIKKEFIEKTEQLGKKIAQHGHELVFGGGAEGLMGASVRGVKSVGGKAIGIVPEFFKGSEFEKLYKDCDELIFTSSMQERKKKMEDFSEAFIITPGGVGTFDEFFEVFTLKHLKQHKKPVVLFNVDGYYNKLIALLDDMIERKFLDEQSRSLYIVTDDIDKILEYIEK